MEFNDFCHDYYTELDGIAITGYINEPSSLQQDRETLSPKISRTLSISVIDEREKSLFDLPVNTEN